MGDEAPRVNLDGSQVSNKNFDEKMIETVNSEQLDSTKGKPDAPEQDPRPMMDHIREVNEDNDNSNPKTASLQRPDKQSDKHRSESGAEAEAELPATGVLADSAPLNEPTFMKEAREQKKETAGGLGGFDSKLKQNLHHPKPKQRPQTSSAKPVKQEVYEVKKKLPIPHFGLKKKKKPEPIPIATILSKKGIAAEPPKPAAEKKQSGAPAPQPAAAEGQVSEEPELKESLEFGKFLKLMQKKVKTEIREIEDQNKWKPKKPKELTQAEVHKNMLEREDALIKKDLLDPMRMMLEEMRKQDLEKAKRDLEAFREKHAIKYPKPKPKEKPPAPEIPKPPEVYKDPIAEANAAIRAGAWKKRDKPKDPAPPQQGEKKSDAGPAEAQTGLFEIAEKEAGDQYVPISKPTLALGQPAEDVNADFGGRAPPEEHPLKNLSENLSKIEAKQAGQAPDFRISSGRQTAKAKAGTKEHRYVEDKKAIFADFKKKEEKLKKLDEEIYVDQLMGQRVKNPKVQEVDLQARQLEEKFLLREKKEDLEKQNLMDVLAAKNKLYRYGEPQKKEVPAPADPGAAKPGFRVRVGAGVLGELERDAQAAEKKDKAVRAKEIARVSLARKELDQLGNEAFKERLKSERELLKKRIELEQERLRELRRQKAKPANEAEAKLQEDQKQKAQAALSALREVDSEEEEAAPGPQPEAPGEAAPKHRLKLKHALKLKDYIAKIDQTNQGMIEHIQERDVAYQELKRHYDEIVAAEARREDQDTRAELEALAGRLGVQHLYSLLAKGDKDAPFIKLSQVPKNLRDAQGLSHQEKKLLKACLCREAGEYLTYNRLESLLLGQEEGAEFRVAKSEQEIENDHRLAQFLESLEAMQRELEDFRGEVDARTIEEYDAAKAIFRFKKRLAKGLLGMGEVMDLIFGRTDALIAQLDGQDSREHMFRELREVDSKNNQKLDQVAGLYQQVLRDYDETRDQMHVQEAFVLGDIEELELREKSLADAALAAAHKVLTLDFHKRNNVLDAIAALGSTKKSVLLVQAWFRGWKARRLYGAKKSMRQRVVFLIRRYAARFKRRSLFKAFREALENLALKRLFAGFKAIAQSPEALYVSRVSASSVRRLERHRRELLLQDEEQSRRPTEANRSAAGPPDARGTASEQGQEEAGFEFESQDEGDQAFAPQPQTQAAFEGKSIYYAIALQRLSRAARGKHNPEKFWLDDRTEIENCMLCHIKKIRIAQPDDIQPLLCLDCFEEGNLNRRRVRHYRSLRTRKAEPASLSEERLLQHARAALLKIQRARKDLFEICRFWDPDGRGSIELGDLDLIVDRLKMLSQPEKDALRTHLGSQQRGGLLAYEAALRELTSKN